MSTQTPNRENTTARGSQAQARLQSTVEPLSNNFGGSRDAPALSSGGPLDSSKNQSLRQAYSNERQWALLNDSSKGGSRGELSPLARWEQQHERDGPWHAIGGVHVGSEKGDGRTGEPTGTAKGLDSDSRSVAATKGSRGSN